MTVHIDKNSWKHLGYSIIPGLFLGRTGFGAAVATGICKEYCDKEYNWYHHWCWWDIGFDILGASIGLALNTVAQLLIFKHLVY